MKEGVYVRIHDRPSEDCNEARRQIDKSRGHSSAGRAPALHAGGRRFDPVWLHQLRWNAVTADAIFASSKFDGALLFNNLD